MALKIVRAADPIKVERLNLVLYAPPGVGKTSLAFTAESPLLLDFDNGAHRAANRKDSVRVVNWSEVTDMTAEDLAGYKTVCVDTAGRALDALTADIIRRNPKAGRGGALTLQGYGTLKSEFVAWIKSVNALGKDVVVIAHMDEQRNGDEIIERLDVQGGSKGEIYKAADAMGRIAIRDGKRVLLFSPTDAAFGKNPGQLAPIEVPHPDKDPAFLAGVIQQIKDRLNAMTEEQAAAQEVLEGWRSVIGQLEQVEHFNEKLAAVKQAPKAAQALFADAAKSKGFTFSKATGEYEAKKVEETTA
jgi:predicted HAD superfamily phosphohydrolase YqeG